MPTTIPTTFVVRNQQGQYLTKKGEWQSGKDAIRIYHQPHQDQALNQLFEMNSKDIELRGKVVELELCEKRRPVILEYGPDPEQPELLVEGGAESTDDAEEYTGVIRPLNVEPRMPKKAQISENSSEEVAD